MKKIILLVIAVLMIGLGLTGVLWPAGLMDFARWSFTPTGLFVAEAVRIIIGLLLVVAAGAAATPTAVRLIGVILIAAGIATTFLNSDTAPRVASWWLENGEDRLRITACLPLAIGLFLGGVTVFQKA